MPATATASSPLRPSAASYWLKRPELLPWIAELAVGGMANRQIARTLRCAPATVDLQLSRLGRHCLLFQRQLPLPPSTCRDIVVDGLVTFEHSQFFPFEILAAVDNDSSFILHFSDAPLRRSGRMTAAQKVKRAKLEARTGRPDPKAVRQRDPGGPSGGGRRSADARSSAATSTRPIRGRYGD